MVERRLDSQMPQHCHCLILVAGPMLSIVWSHRAVRDVSDYLSMVDYGVRRDSGMCQNPAAAGGRLLVPWLGLVGGDWGSLL